MPAGMLAWAGLEKIWSEIPNIAVLRLPKREAELRWHDGLRQCGRTITFKSHHFIMFDNIWPLVGFHVFIFIVLALDLGVFNRKSHVVSLRESLIWTAVWVTLALSFNLGVWYYKGSDKALEFLTGYVIEYSLSVDNIFVFVMLFTYFRVPAEYQHKVLFWGIIGALVMRATMIILGAVLIAQFNWILYIFGAFLVITGIKMLFKGDEKVDPEKNPIIRWFKRIVPVTSDYRGSKFWVRENGVLHATPLFVILILVELTDVVFAVDSIPAIFAITQDPFIVYTSNIFAILGLRSLYFALAGIIDKFHYLKIGLGLTLAFVGTKMLLGHTPYKIGIMPSLVTIVSILSASVIASILFPRKTPATDDGDLPGT